MHFLSPFRSDSLDIVRRELSFWRSRARRVWHALGSTEATKRWLVLSAFPLLAAAVWTAWDRLPVPRSDDLPGLIIFRIVHEEAVATPYQLFARHLIDELRGEAPAPDINSDLSLECPESENGEARIASVPTAGSFDTVLSIEAVAAWNRDIDQPLPPLVRDLIAACKMTHGKTYAIGLAQSDVLYHYLNGGHPQFPVGRPDSSVRALVKLFPEWLHLYRTGVPLNIADFDQACGTAEGSGNLVTALNAARVFQANWQTRVHTCRKQPAEIDDVVTDDGVARPGEDPDAAAIAEAGLLNVRVFSPPARRQDLGTLLFLTLAEAQIMQNAFGSKVYDLVGAAELGRHYKAATSSDATVAVNSVLIGDKDLPVPIVKSLVAVGDPPALPGRPAPFDVSGSHVRNSFP